MLEEVMINCIQHEDEYWITFKYDFDLVCKVKRVPGRIWHPERKYWSIPKQNLGMFINQIKGTEYEDLLTIKSNENININETLDNKIKIPDIDISDVHKYVHEGNRLYSHQLDFLKFAIDRENHENLNGFLVADQMGVGKTIQAINLALYNKEKYHFKHCLIICCINMSKYNWRDEINYHTNGEYEGYILGTRLNKRTGEPNFNGSSKDKLEDLQTGFKYHNRDSGKLPYFLILNIEAIRMKSGRLHPIADELIKLINKDELNMIVIDEVHKNISPTSQQGKQILRIKKSTKDKCLWLPMTGTPIVNKPTDLFLPLRLVSAHGTNSYYTWNQSYCIYGGYGGHEIVGYKNIDMLKSVLQPNMIRRLKEDVLDLPDKVELIEYVENSAYQKKLYKEIENEIWSQRDSILSSLNPLSKMLRLRQVNGSPELVDENCVVDKDYRKKNAKLSRLLELVEDIIQGRGEKVVIFSNWVEPLRMIYAFLIKSYKVCCFTGTMNEKDRQHHKKVFLENLEYKIMIGTIGALGTTHTLTAANNVIFYDEPWTMADRQQACDRVHRIGASKSVNIYTLITKDTIDDRVHNILYNKGMMSNFIVDNQIDIYNNPDLFNMLMGKK